MFPEFKDLQAGLSHSILATWILDIDAIGFIWANAAAIELWQAADLADLVARDLSGGTPQSVVDRTNLLIEQVRAGKQVREEWTFYPKGKPLTVSLDLCGVLLDDGRLAMLNQALPLVTESASLLRLVAMFRHTTAMIALLRGDGSVWAQNPAATVSFGDLESWRSCFLDPAQADAMLQTALAGDTASTLARIETRAGPRWHLVHARALRDPVSGELGVLVEHNDETPRIEAELLAADRGQRIDDLRAALELVERQRREILELSAPMLDVGAQTLAVPIIGRFDAEQSAAITAKLLDAVHLRGVRHVLLDLTGVAGIDERSAARLQELLRALRLLGATPTLTGIRAAVADELSQCDVELDDVATLRSLAAGLRRRSL